MVSQLTSASFKTDGLIQYPGAMNFGYDNLIIYGWAETRLRESHSVILIAQCANVYAFYVRRFLRKKQVRL